VFGMLSKCSDCPHLACHSHSCSKSLESRWRACCSSKSVFLDCTKIHTKVHPQTMILDDQEDDQDLMTRIGRILRIRPNRVKVV